MTVRGVWFKQSAGFIKLLRGALSAQAGYLQGLEKEDFFHRAKPFEDDKEDEKQLKYEHKRQGSKKTANGAKLCRHCMNLLRSWLEL